MSKILSEKAEEVVVKRKRKLIGIKCDICGWMLPPNPTAKYYRVTTGHNGWNGNSNESIEHYDICPDCIVLFVSHYLNDVNSDESDTKYIEIQTELACKRESVYE